MAKAIAIAQFITIFCFTAQILNAMGIYAAVGTYQYIKISDYTLQNNTQRFNESISTIGAPKSGILSSLEYLYSLAEFLWKGLVLIFSILINTVIFPLTLGLPPYNLDPLLVGLISAVVYISYFLSVGQILTGRQIEE